MKRSFYRNRGQFYFFFFFFNDTATTEIYTFSLHDALPISRARLRGKMEIVFVMPDYYSEFPKACMDGDRKSTRLNSSHLVISYAVFCLKKKKSSSILGTLSRLHNSL